MSKRGSSSRWYQKQVSDPFVKEREKQGMRSRAAFKLTELLDRDRLLRPGGVYVFDSPHRFSGPHDVSVHFGETLDCFHFQEWTYRDMRKLLKRHGFSRTGIHRKGRLFRNPLVNLAHDCVEAIVGVLPRPLRRSLSNRLFQSVTLSAWKDS